MKKFILFTLVLASFASVINATTKTSIKASELPKVVSEDISKHFTGYSIEEAFKVENNGVTQFEVLVQKANDKLVLSYDKDGKFVKKSAVSTAKKMELTKPENKAVTKTAKK
jgi:hypothetical protein